MNLFTKINAIKIASLISAFVLILGASLVASNALAIASSEDTAVLCTDGADNDGDENVDGSDPDCAASLVPPAPVFVPENTEALCKNGLDDDGDENVDGSDPDCAASLVPPAPVFVPENTEALCKNGLDDDGDENVDGSDPDCAAFLTVATPTPAVVETPAPAVSTGPTAVSSGGGSGGFSSIPTGQSVLGAFTATPTPAVVGNAQSCSPYLLKYLKYGKKNDSKEVKKLQVFLNKFEGTTFKINGIFDKKLDRAVRNLQKKYSTEILMPWVQAGKAKTIDSTGYVFKTTKWFINSKMCPEAAEAFPKL